MDPKDLILTETEASPARRIEAPPWKYLSANAYENPSQSRIRRIDRKARDGIEDDRRRVLPHQCGKNHHCATSRHVPLGRAVSQGGERRRAPSDKNKRDQLGPANSTLVGGDGSQFSRYRGVRSDGYRVYPSDD